jgi:hypothetical protein
MPLFPSLFSFSLFFHTHAKEGEGKGGKGEGKGKGRKGESLNAMACQRDTTNIRWRASFTQITPSALLSIIKKSMRL